MGKERAIQVQETQRVPYTVDPKKNMPRHILINLNTKKKIIKRSKGKSLNTRGCPKG